MQRLRSSRKSGSDLMLKVDKQFFDAPFYGVRQMTWHLTSGHAVNEKRIRRLMRALSAFCVAIASRATDADLPKAQNQHACERPQDLIPTCCGLRIERPIRFGAPTSLRQVGWRCCMRCQRPFWSDDVVRLRICDRCKMRIE